MSNINSLKSLLKEDQDNIRQYKEGKVGLDEFSKKANIINAQFAEWLKTNDIPDYQLKEEEYTAFVALLLHSGEKLMTEVLNLFFDKIRSKDRAYIIDKARVLKNEPQIYGTQYKRIKDGKVDFLPIENPEEIDQRRGEVGLESIAEYEKKILEL